MNEVESKKSPMKWIVVGTVIGIVVIGIVVASLISAYNILNRPKPEITLVNGYESFQGLNYVYKVDVTVKNNGADGWIKVYAEISGTGRYEKQEERTYLTNGESKSLQFVFDISFWEAISSPSITYHAWAVVD